MDLISAVSKAETEDTIPAILEQLKQSIDRVLSNVEYIQPGQGAEIAGLIFEMLAAAHGRTGDDLLLKPAKKALNGLAQAIKPALEETQPDQCNRLYKLLAGAEFTIASRHSVERRQKERVEAAKEAGIDVGPVEAE